MPTCQEQQLPSFLLSTKPTGMETQSVAMSVDDSYLSLLLPPTDCQNLLHDQSLMSDHHYAQELQLQEAIMAQIPRTPNNISVDQQLRKRSKTVAGEPSRTLCEICADRKDGDQMFSVPNCSHRFCTECITKHVSITIKKRAIVHRHEEARSLTCPGVDCKGVLEIEACRGIVADDVLASWDDVICESMIAPSQRFYCPYNNCSGLLVNDSGGIREAECPLCRRLMCVRCNVPWHSGFDCEEFSRLREDERGGDDLMVHELAKQNKWQRCPNCKFFVEKNQGCLHITCR
ncbi:putative E3 ubiquitin-protein ligase rbrA [Sesamum angolense]|uniref:RBR-type E3 ubiquitin transferase n=1 Tax=Sesamum angolense TaxID=2727404 RepID=A0AAE1XEZ0_9LAMI|nr:putative E3 ubiquitin-protein ligase rbrA [Sesamum angolense]